MSEKAEKPPALEVETPAWYGRAHHRKDGGGFRNPWEPEERPPLLRTLGWLASHGLRARPERPASVVRLTAEEIRRDPERFRIFWLGHSTALVRIGGRNVLTDPIFSPRATPFPFGKPERLVELPIPPSELPRIDLVLISHNHYDHLDRASIEALARDHRPVFLVPLGLRTLLESFGAERVQELDWWQSVRVDGVRIHAVPARHASQRGITDHGQTLWTGWYLQSETAGEKIYFAGCTAYAPHFREIRERLGPPDVAMLPIGAYLPRWLMRFVHMVPEESVQAFQDLEARTLLAIHWGTFDLADEPVHEPAEAVARVAAERGIAAERIRILPVGGSLSESGGNA